MDTDMNVIHPHPNQDQDSSSSTSRKRLKPDADPPTPTPVTIIRNPNIIPNPRLVSFFEGIPEEKFVDDQKSLFFASAQNNPDRYRKEPDSLQKTPTVTLEEIKESLNTSIVYRKDTLAQAEMCLSTGRVKINSNGKARGRRITEIYGYDDQENKVQYLWPEEALYLTEIGKLEIFVENVPLSVERARALLLCPNANGVSSLSSNKCDIDCYTVFKYLSKMGYRLRRRININQGKKEEMMMNIGEDVSNSNCNSAETTAIIIDENMMDVEQEVEVIETETDDNDNVTEIPEEIDLEPESDVIIIQMPTFSESEFSEMRAADGDSSSNIIIDNEMPSTSTGQQASANIPAEEEDYYVVEAADSDSDVEFVQEISNTHGVQIVELEYVPGMVYECEAGTSKSSKVQQVTVDLVSSDEENEPIVVEVFHSVLDKFKPNATFQLGFPPAILLPPNIQPRDKDFSREINLKIKNNNTSKSSSSSNQNKIEEMQLGVEMLDSLHIDIDTPLPPVQKVNCSSWKEWRQIVMEEARELITSSLIGQTSTGGSTNTNEGIGSKLHLWHDKNDQNVDQEMKDEAAEPELMENDEMIVRNAEIQYQLNISQVPYDLYSPTGTNNSVHRKGLAKIQPYARVAISRTDDNVPYHNHEGSDYKHHKNSSIPLVIAVLGDNSDIIFLTPDGSTLPSLFNNGTISPPQ